MNTQTMIVALAAAVDALHRCIELGASEWEADWRDRIAQLESDLPSGSGFDNGTRVVIDESSADKIVLETAFHHMNDAGMDSGWTEHKVTIRPSLLCGFSLSVSGRDRNDIKSYISNYLGHNLRQQAPDVPWSRATVTGSM